MSPIRARRRWPWDSDASVVIPSRGNSHYSTRLTTRDRQRPHPLDGRSAGGAHWYGSGNPGDENLQFGVHIEVVAAADDGSWGAVRVWNERVDYVLEASSRVVGAGEPLTLTLKATNYGSLGAAVRYTVSLPAALEHLEGELSGWMDLDPIDAGSGHAERSVVVGAASGLAPGTEMTVTAAFDDGSDVWHRRLNLVTPYQIFMPAADRFGNR